MLIPFPLAFLTGAALFDAAGGSQYDASTGEVKAGPATKGIQVYRVNEVAGGVELVL